MQQHRVENIRAVDVDASSLGDISSRAVSK
jgi:hypothetical protein